jgi:hypothetical protein
MAVTAKNYPGNTKSYHLVLPIDFLKKFDTIQGLLFLIDFLSAASKTGT